MKLSVKQLKQLVRESAEEMGLSSSNQDHDQLSSIYSDVYKEKYGTRPRHVDFSKYSTEELQKMVDDLEQEMSTVDYSHDEEMEDMIDQHGHDADEADREAMARQEEDDLMRTPEEGEDLSSRSGMGRRLAESLKLVVREAIEECGYEESLDEYGNPEEQALEEFLSEGKAKPKKKKPVDAKKDKPKTGKKMNSGFAAFIKKAKEKAKK
jgi:hypothetical protein